MARYKAVRVSVDHPLARPNASMNRDGSTVQIWEHRLVLFDKIGYGPHLCHWCGKIVSWTDGLNPATSLCCDHLDEDARNNSPANLVPSCHPCNAMRGRRVADDELFVERQGKRSRAERRVCLTCEEPFLIARANLRAKPSAGRYCSKRCMWDRRKHV